MRNSADERDFSLAMRFMDALIHTMKPSMIVALDVPDTAGIATVLGKMPAEVQWFKVGLELFCAGGPDTLSPLLAARKSIFLDLKLHDIPRTVERAVQSASRHGAMLLTVHASGGRAMLEAAADAARSAGAKRPRIVAVTALTSLDESDFADLGINRSPSDQVLRLAELAVSCGIDGLVCSPQEVARLRSALGKEPLLVTPGIRMPGAAAGDQKRTGTPREAVRDGATHLVVGRPILEAPDPSAAARAILQEIENA
jgi:orotidine-5'-phosphate decarboxylase